MKTGRTLTELAIELERQSETKKDFIASTEVLEMTDKAEITLEDNAPLSVTEHAHTQIAARLDIPAKYYPSFVTLVEEKYSWLLSSDA
jgi:uncharacterized protein (DUF1778 family)